MSDISEKYPLIGVGGLIVDGENILLIQRGKEPGRGLWSIPGGRLEWGESLAEAAQREVFEETGLTVKASAIAGITEVRLPSDTNPPDFHYVLIDLFCKITNGEPCCAGDAMDVAWFKIDDLDTLPTTDGLAEKVRSWTTNRSED